MIGSMSRWRPPARAADRCLARCAAAAGLLAAGCGSSAALQVGAGGTASGTGQPSAGASAGPATGAASPTAGPGDACSLVTPSEAVSATGASALTAHPSAGGEACTYTSVSAAGAVAVVVRVARGAEISGGDPQRALQSIAQQHSGRTAAGGVVIFADSSRGRSAAFVKDGALVIIGVAGVQVSDDVLTGLATTAQSRL